MYLGVTLDCSLTFKEHVAKTKAKVSTRNNIFRKLTKSKWGASLHVQRNTALALLFSAAGDACPVWEHSAHASHLHLVLNASWRLSTGCLKPTNASNLHLLAGLAFPEIRREAASKQERLIQVMIPATCCSITSPPYRKVKIKKKNSALRRFSRRKDYNLERGSMGRKHRRKKLEELPSSNHLNIKPDESLPPGSQVE